MRKPKSQNNPYTTVYKQTKKKSLRSRIEIQTTHFRVINYTLRLRCILDADFQQKLKMYEAV